jgi:hypothetical protein
VPGAGHHEQRRQRIDGADEPGAPVNRRPVLGGGERRHDEHAAGDRQRRKVDGGMDGARPPEELGEAFGGRRRRQA